MPGGGFHVARRVATLPKLFRTYRRAVAGYTSEERDATFDANAERIFRI